MGKEVDLEQYYNKTIKLLGDVLSHFTIGKEQHSISKLYHIHWYLRYKKRVNVYPTTYDNVFGKHGNLRIGKQGNPKKNQCQMLKYVTKQGNFMDYPDDWDSQLFIKENDKSVNVKAPLKTNIIAKGVMDGKYKDRVDVANNGFPGLAMMHGNKIDEFASIYRDEKEYLRTRGIQWRPLKLTMKWGLEWYQIMVWLNFYIRNPENNKGKIKHLYIHGQCNLGKTTRLLDPLKERLNIYYISKDQLQNLPWKNDKYDLCILDDYKGEKPITWMNEFLGSRNMNIRVPGGFHNKKTQIVPTIIISNTTLAQCYQEHIESHGRDEIFQAFENRFQVIHLKQQGNPFGISQDDKELLINLEYQFNNPKDFVEEEENN